MNDAKQTSQTVQHKLISFGMTATQQVKNQSHENQKRATQMGPVLNGILHSHWDHWGLNE